MEILGVLASTIGVLDLTFKVVKDFNALHRDVSRLDEMWNAMNDALENIRLASIAENFPEGEIRSVLLEIENSLKVIRKLRMQETDTSWTKIRRFGLYMMGRKSPIEKAVGQLQNQLHQLYLASGRWQSGKRENFIDKVRESPQFVDLDEYGKAIVEALLTQYRNSSTAEEETKYVISSTQLINRVFGLGPAGSVTIGIDQAGEDAIRQEANRGLLDLISYAAMEHRGSGIEPAFDSSCHWVFEESPQNKWSNLSNWLVRESGLYLIQGNEGSGKSTMMKYIYTRPETVTCLSKWARPDPLVMAAFYFWRSGTRLEKSEEGLLRSLLHSVLSQQPHLMPIVFPREWAALYTAASNYWSSSSPGLGAWEVKDLRDAFLKLVGQERIPMKLFFLVDGVDEYQCEDNDGNPFAIVEFLKTQIAASANTKILISSRQLDAFETSGIQPQVRLDDLNRGDIESYVRKVLDSDKKFRNAQEADRESADAIIRKILETSGGVFLCAVLCVNTIKANLAEGKTLAIISEDFGGQLDPALQNLYQTLWSKMDSIVKRPASQIARIMHARTDVVRSATEGGEGNMRLVDLALALGNPRETIISPIMPWPRCEGRIQAQCDKVAKEFMTAWPGFITTAEPKQEGSVWNPSSPIQYCHRSVPEFFRRKSETLRAAAEEEEAFTFCPRIALLKSAVQQLKYVPSDTPLRQLWAFATMALLAANYADSMQGLDEELELDPVYLDLLEQLDNTMQRHHDRLQRGRDGHYLESKMQDPNGIVGINDRGRASKRIAKMHWSNFHFDPACSPRRGHDNSFLSLSVQFGLRNYVNYVAARLRKEDKLEKILRPKKGRPLLDYALVPSPIAPYDLVRLTLVETLLDLGASPNDKFEKQTSWERALQWQYEAFVESNASVVRATGSTSADAQSAAENRVWIFKLLIKEKGADKRASILNSKLRRITARQVVEESFTRRVRDEVLKSLLDEFSAESVQTRTWTFGG